MVASINIIICFVNSDKHCIYVSITLVCTLFTVFLIPEKKVNSNIGMKSYLMAKVEEKEYEA